MPDPYLIANRLLLGREATEGEKHRRAYISPEEPRGRAWLPWKSHRCEHGLRLHKVGSDGLVQEIEDKSGQVVTKKKPRRLAPGSGRGAVFL
jgi:hypothetical protein